MPLQLRVKKTEGKPGKVYYPLELKDVPEPTPGPGQLLVRIKAAALNHRDHFIRQHLYPAISFDAPMLADGCGVVAALGPDVSARARSLLGRAVLLTPSRGWAADPAGPEDLARFAVTGSSLLCEDAGCAAEYAVVPEAEVEPAPEHLSPVEAAALPVVGLTAWRALVTKAGVSPSRGGGGGGGGGGCDGPRKNVLVTGIGGGVALTALQLAVAMGCRVFVTSGDPAKIARAVAELGAEAGVSYKEADWDARLAALLPADRPSLDAVIDGAGGDVVKRSLRLLRPGGVISSYGMTVAPRMDWLMPAVLKQIELRGTTMGSRAEFSDMVAFVRERRIVPVVSRVVRGLDNLDGIEGLFDDLKAGRQFGKLVIEIADDSDKSPPKL
ncbi:hypothetical protein RB595_005786 [Gaeumannomyces hyphopodioides]